MYKFQTTCQVPPNPIPIVKALALLERALITYRLCIILYYSMLYCTIFLQFYIILYYLIIYTSVHLSMHSSVHASIHADLYMAVSDMT